eukprot:scaffold69268_cov75-Phaeocystis_antarctica.AAC.2
MLERRPIAAGRQQLRHHRGVPAPDGVVDRGVLLLRHDGLEAAGGRVVQRCRVVLVSHVDVGAALDALLHHSRLPVEARDVQRRVAVLTARVHLVTRMARSHRVARVCALHEVSLGAARPESCGEAGKRAAAHLYLVEEAAQRLEVAGLSRLEHGSHPRVDRLALTLTLELECCLTDTLLLLL